MENGKETPRTQVIFLSLLPTKGRVFGKEKRIRGVMTEDGIEEKM